MAQVPRTTLEQYRRSLDAVCSGAGDQVARRVRSFIQLNPNATVEQLRNASVEIADAVLGEYGDAASELACQLFDTVMDAEGTGIRAQALGEPSHEAVEGTVRRVAGTVDGTPESLQAFSDAVGSFASFETRRVANRTAEANVERAARTRSGAKVRFARVPRSMEPCAWCAMLASRGFVYRTQEDAAAASHHDCTCDVVPGVKDSTTVPGYDPGYYKAVWIGSKSAGK